MKEKHRQSGIELIGEIPWGTHLCQFYQTREDLLDILVPYFKAGLENNEFCMLVTSEPLNTKEAEKALSKAVPHFDRFRKKGQIEIISHRNWYLKDGTFNMKRVLNGWIDKLNQALKNGFDGLRLTGNTAWLEKKDWKSFAEYEEEINRVIGDYKMIAICTYSLENCGATEIIEVVANHQFALIKRKGIWEIIESAARKEVLEKLLKYLEENRAILTAMPDMMFVQNQDGTYLEYNIPNNYTSPLFSSHILGKNMMDVLPKEVAEIGLKLGQDAIQTGKVQSFEFQLTIDDNIQHFEARLISFERDKVLFLMRDITGRKQAEDRIKASLKEKEIMLQEIAHRVKNNLQVISSLLNLKSRAVKHKKDAGVFQDCRNFVRSMALIHEKLYRSEDLAKIDFKKSVETIAKELVRAYYPEEPGKAALKLDLEEVSLGIDSAIPCGLVLNELITNSLKHGFPGARRGEIKVALHPRKKNNIELVVSDNGIGFPRDLDFRTADTFGLHLVTGLVEKQLHGKIEFSGRPGTEVRIAFPGR